MKNGKTANLSLKSVREVFRSKYGFLSENIINQEILALSKKRNFNEEDVAKADNNIKLKLKRSYEGLEGQQQSNDSLFPNIAQKNSQDMSRQHDLSARDMYMKRSKLSMSNDPAYPRKESNERSKSITPTSREHTKPV